jgi:hypothetical protein
LHESVALPLQVAPIAFSSIGARISSCILRERCVERDGRGTYYCKDGLCLKKAATRSHYGKFLQVYNEYQDLKQQDPTFEPARSVRPAFVHQPADTGRVDLITDPVTAGVSNLFNASYATLLSILNRFFLHGGETDDEFKLLSDISVDLMFNAIRPVGILLTTLPIDPDHPEVKAGASFETYRLGSHPLPHRYGAWVIIHERLVELADFSAHLKSNASVANELTVVESSLRTLAARLAPHTGKGEQNAPLPE